MLYNYKRSYCERDYIIKYNLKNLKKLPKISFIDIESKLVVDDLSSFSLKRIIAMVDFLENISMQKIFIKGDLKENKYDREKKKEIFLKTTLRGYNKKQFLNYIFYVFIPVSKIKDLEGVFVKNENNFQIKVYTNKVFYGLSKELYGGLKIEIGLSIDKNVKKYINILGLSK